MTRSRRDSVLHQTILVNYDLDCRLWHMTITGDKTLSCSTDGEVESLSTKVGEESIFFRKAGKGPPVLLLHGGACDSTDWMETMVALRDQYTFYAPDLPGYGRSDRNRDGYYLSDLVNTTIGLIQALELESLAVVGHSLGGRVSLEIAFRRPELVRKLVLIDTAGFSRLAHWGSFLGTMAFLVRKALGRPQPYPRFLMEDDAKPHWLCLDRLPELKMPSLIIWNRRDPYYTVRGALKAKDLIPRVRLEIFPGYGHAPHRTNRESFHRILTGFLAEP